MPVCEDYRKKALACVMMAKGMQDPREREDMLRVAREYMRLHDFVGDASAYPGEEPQLGRDS